jgi:Flp pilus assembly protein TadB
MAATSPHLTAHARTPRANSSSTPADLSTAGGGTLIVLSYLILIPGVLPTLALTAVLVAAVVLPALVLGVAAALVLGPPYGLWRVATRARRRRRREETRARVLLA